MDKGVTIVAKLLGGKRIDEETKAISGSVDAMADDVKAADAEVGESGGGYELFRKKQEKELDKSKKNDKSFLSSSLSTFSKWGAIAGAAIVGGFGYESVKKTLAIQETEDALKNALKNAGQLHAGTMQTITSQAAALSTKGGFTQEEQLSGITQLTSQTGNYTIALKENALATNIARQYHLGYAQAIKMVTMANTGSTGRLQKYFGIIQPVKTAMEAVQAAEVNMSKAEKAANGPARQRAELEDKRLTALKAIAAGEERAHGAAASFSKTTAGYISNLKNSLDALELTVGRKLLPVLTKWLKTGVSVITWILNTKAVLIPLVSILGLLMAAFAVEKVIEFAKAIKGLTAAQWLWNFALDANPIGIIVIAIAGLIAIFVVAYARIGWFREGVQDAFKIVKNVVVDVFDWMKHNWPLVAGILLGPFALAIIQIIQHWNAVIGFIKSVPGKLANAGKGMWNFIKEGFKEAIDWILSGWNKLHFRMPGISTPFGHIGGFNIGLPHIPLLAQGGNVIRGGTAIVGDRGPELLSMPPGAKVLPLTPSQRGNNGLLGSWGGGPSGDLHVHVEMDRREVAQAIFREFQTMEARR